MLLSASSATGSFRSPADQLWVVSLNKARGFLKKQLCVLAAKSFFSGTQAGKLSHASTLINMKPTGHVMRRQIIRPYIPRTLRCGHRTEGKYGIVFATCKAVVTACHSPRKSLSALYRHYGNSTAGLPSGAFLV